MKPNLFGTSLVVFATLLALSSSVEAACTTRAQAYPVYTTGGGGLQSCVDATFFPPHVNTGCVASVKAGWVFPFSSATGNPWISVRVDDKSGLPVLFKIRNTDPESGWNGAEEICIRICSLDTGDSGVVYLAWSYIDPFQIYQRVGEFFVPPTTGTVYFTSC